MEVAGETSKSMEGFTVWAFQETSVIPRDVAMSDPRRSPFHRTGFPCILHVVLFMAFQYVVLLVYLGSSEVFRMHDDFFTSF